MYIHAPLTPRQITITKARVPRIKKAKRNEIPEDYRKPEKLKSIISEILLYFIGFTEFIRKGFKK